MVVKIFSEQEDPPSYFVGGHLEGMPHANLQSPNTFITELDESDGSFLEVTATNAIITNIEHEHIDFYKTKDDMVSAFMSLFQIPLIIMGNAPLILMTHCLKSYTKNFRKKMLLSPMELRIKNPKYERKILNINGMAFHLIC